MGLELSRRTKRLTLSGAGLVVAVIAGVGLLQIVETQTAQAGTSEQGNLVLYYKFDETTGNVTDYSGNDFTGSKGGSPIIDDDTPSAIDFDNPYSIFFTPGEYVLGPKFSSLDTDGEVTFSAWIKTYNFADRQTIFSSTENGGYNLEINGTSAPADYGCASGTLCAHISTSGSGGGSSYATAQQSLSSLESYKGDWMHVAMTYSPDSQQLRLYVNGTLRGVDSTTGNVDAPDAGTALCIGMEASGTGCGGNEYHGWIDDTRIYNRELSSTELDDIAAGQNPAATWDGSTSQNFATASNWTPAFVPDATTEIIIPSGTPHSPRLYNKDYAVASLTIKSGATFTTATHNLRIMNGSNGLSNNGTLYMYGNEALITKNGVRFNDTNSGTVSYYGSGNYSSLPAGNSYYNIEFSNGGETTIPGNLTVNGDLKIEASDTLSSGNHNMTIDDDLLLAGQLDGGSATINLAGDWNNLGGTFNYGTSTVNLNGENQAINGNNTFYNLTKSTATADTLTLAAGTTQTIANNLKLSGASGNLLALVSSVPGTQATIDPAGDVTASYVDVIDNNNSSDNAILARHSTDSGNNTNWTFDNTAPNAPTANPDSDVYGAAQSVTLSATDNTGGTGIDAIYYTLDGSTPSSSSTEYTGAIDISSDTTLKAIAYDKSDNASSVASFSYIFDTAPPPVPNIDPFFSPTADNTPRFTWGTVWDNGPAGLADPTYTIELSQDANFASGVTTDTSNGGGYAAAELADGTWYIRIKASDTVGNDSAWSTTKSLIIDTIAPPAPTASLASGTYGGTQTVTLSNSESDAKIYYTTDGSTPTRSSTLYTDSITVSSSTTIKAVAYDLVRNASDVITENYIIDTAGPDISNIQVATASSGQSATITWKTDESASSQIAIGTTSSSIDAKYAERDTDPRVLSHSYDVADLKPCTVYYFQAMSTDTFSNQTLGTVHSLTTNGCAGEVTTHVEEVVGAASGGTLSLGDITVTMPSGFAISDVTLQIKQLDAAGAINTIGQPGQLVQIGDYVYDIKVLNSVSTTVDDFLLPLMITFNYDAGNLIRKIPSTVTMYHYDGATGWTELDGCSTDAAAKTVTCLTSSFSVFALAAAATNNQAADGSGSGLGSSSSSDPDASNSDIPGAPNTGLAPKGMLVFAVTILVGAGLLLSQTRLYRNVRTKA